MGQQPDISEPFVGSIFLFSHSPLFRCGHGPRLWKPNAWKILIFIPGFMVYIILAYAVGKKRKHFQLEADRWAFQEFGCKERRGKKKIYRSEKQWGPPDLASPHSLSEVSYYWLLLSKKRKEGGRTNRACYRYYIGLQVTTKDKQSMFAWKSFILVQRRLPHLAPFWKTSTNLF